MTIRTRAIIKQGPVTDRNHYTTVLYFVTTIYGVNPASCSLITLFFTRQNATSSGNGCCKTKSDSRGVGMGRAVAGRDFNRFRSRSFNLIGDEAVNIRNSIWNDTSNLTPTCDQGTNPNASSQKDHPIRGSPCSALLYDFRNRIVLAEDASPSPSAAVPCGFSALLQQHRRHRLQLLRIRRQQQTITALGLT